MCAWEPETARTVTKPFAWTPDAWYHLKLLGTSLTPMIVHVRFIAFPLSA